MQSGYVKLFRKLLDSGIIKNAQLWQFMTWCLLKASHKKHTEIVGNIIIDLEPGQFVFGRMKAARELNQSEQKIRSSLKVLKSNQQITIKSTNKYSIITIVNWGSYQGSDSKNNQQITNKQPTDNQQITTNKNEKKEYNALRGDSGNIEFDEVWNLYNYKRGKKDAEKAFKKLNADDVQKLKDSIPVYLEEIKKKNIQQKYLQGYINDRRFEDEFKCDVIINQEEERGVVKI